MTQNAGSENSAGDKAPEMVVKALALGPFQTNCYVFGCKETKKAAVIDPGFEPEWILSVVEDEKLVVEKVLLTHGHVDHVSAVDAVVKATGASVAIHEADLPIYMAAPRMAMAFGIRAAQPPEPDQTLADGDQVEVGNLKLETIHTPGHSPGSVSFLVKGHKLLFSGDTLFYRGIGRTDFPGGSFGEISRSIRTRLYCLDGAIEVLSGHGPPTTLREEMLMNPFVTL